MTDDLVYRFGDFALEAAERRLLRDGRAIKLTPKAFHTLLLLVKHAGHVVAKDAILAEVWPDTFVEEGTLTQNISVLRKALGGGSFIETVSKGGYRFTAPVKAVRTSGPGVTTDRPERSLAVLPLDDLSGDPAQAYFADGITEALIATLARIGSLRVTSRSSVARYRGTRPPMPEIVRALDVDLVIEGSVTRAGGRVRVTAQLIDARADAHLWAETYDRDLADVLQLQSEIARTIAQAIAVRLTPQDERRLATRPVNPAAYDAYLRGRYFWNRRTAEGFRQGLSWFERAMQLDSHYALVYARVADCHAALEAAGDQPSPASGAVAAQSARRALDIDDTLAEAHAALGLVKFRVDWDWRGAEHEMRRALELNPMSASTHHAYALFLTAAGRHPEATIEITRAAEIDPATFVLNSSAARVPYLAHRFDEAIATADRLIAADDDFAQPYIDRGLALAHAGRGDEAVTSLERGAALAGRSHGALAALAVGYALAGRRADADRVRDQLSGSGAPATSAFYLASISASLHDFERALDQLDRAYEDRSGLLVYLGVDPVFDELRERGRFARLLRAVGVPL
jgi:TolB-like protein/Flp pilus assembly protein TadD